MKKRKGAPAGPPSPADDGPSCEFCSCTDSRPCGPLPCFWATPTRCAYCVPLRVLLQHEQGLAWLAALLSACVAGETIDVGQETENLHRLNQLATDAREGEPPC